MALKWHDSTDSKIATFSQGDFHHVISIVRTFFVLEENFHEPCLRVDSLHASSFMYNTFSVAPFYPKVAFMLTQFGFLGQRCVIFLNKCHYTF